MKRAHPDARRGLPSVSSLLEDPRILALTKNHPRSVVADAVRAVISDARTDAASRRDEPDWVALVEARLAAVTRPSLRPVINATGIVLHTNLGRAPLARAAIDAIREVSAYSTLEYDADTGTRGSRDAHCANLLRELTGAEDALVVNNCAAALVLALNTLATSRDVVISRGELVEIGGSFRIPDIMSRSGARLVEVGTTNRTHLLDYRASITERTAAIVKIHRSNFEIAGFTSEASLAELSALGAERGIPVVFDLGSGLLISLAEYGFPHEPTASEAIADGASLVLMSGDKLLGGPQAGVVVGRHDVVSQLRRNPLARAMRVDKITLAALDATLALYRDPAEAVREIPTLAMLTTRADELRPRAEAMVARLARSGVTSRIVSTDAAVGAGAFPTHKIPSLAVAIAGDAESRAHSLRTGEPPIVGRIHENELMLDLRTVSPEQDELIVRALQS